MAYPEMLLLVMMVAWTQMWTTSAVVAEDVHEDFPFQIRMIEMKNDSTGAVIYDLHFESQQPMDDQSPWAALEALTGTFPFEAMYGDVSWTRCFKGDEHYTCISTLKVENPDRLGQGVGFHLRAQTEDGRFELHTIIPKPSRVQMPVTRLRGVQNDDILTSHPPRHVSFNTGDDVTLKWDFTVRTELSVVISRQLFLTSNATYDEIAYYYRNIDEPKKSFKNIDVTVQSEPVDDHSTRYVFELIIKSASMDDIGLYDFKIEHQRILVEVNHNDRNSIYPTDDPLIDLNGCILGRRLVNSQRGLCLHCNAVDENLSDVAIYHGNDIVSTSDGHIYEIWNRDEGFKKAYYVVPTPTQEDAGSYRCDVTLNDGSVTSVSTEVYYSEVELSINSFEMIYQDGLKMILRCEATVVEGLSHTMYFAGFFADSTPKVTIDQSMGPYEVNIQHDDDSNQVHGELLVHLNSPDGTNLPNSFYCYIRNEFGRAFQPAHNLK